MPDCPQCAAYRDLLASDVRVMDAQVELLRALLLGLKHDADANAYMTAAIEKAITLSDRGLRVVQVLSPAPAIVQ
jgi:hypothetical protein